MTHTKEEYHRQRKALITLLGGKCRECEATTNLEFHTIDGSGEHGCGGWKKLYLVKLNMDKNNVLLLCEDCHRELHQAYGFRKNEYQVNFVRLNNGDN